MSEQTSTPGAKAPQWQMLASPGHSLFAQVSAYSAKVRTAAIALAVAAALGYLVLMATPILASISNGAGSAAGWVVWKFERMLGPDIPAADPAPMVRTFRSAANPPNVFSFVADMSEVTSSDQLRTNMLALQTAFRAGQKIDPCAPGKKATEPWAAPGDLGVRCKYSADGSRLWVWMLVNTNGSFGWYVGLVRKAGADAVVLNLKEPGLVAINGIESIEAAAIPRAIALDFPELKLADTTGAK